LVNRPGRTATNLAGIASSGLDVTLEDTATTDLHAALANSGTYQPDGRNLSPLNALDTTPRTALLSVFNGIPATGEWRLFIADVATGDTATLTSWSVAITGTSIPEPSAALLLGFGSLALLRRRR
jgi:PEP-CTERM motif